MRAATNQHLAHKSALATKSFWVATTRPRMVKGGTRPYRDLILRDRLGHAGVKVKWEPVEARHGVNAQADAPRGYAAATFSGRYSQFTAMPDSAPVTPNHACGRRKQGSPLVIKAKAPATCSAGVTPGSPGTYSAALAQPAEHCPSKSDVAGSSPASRSKLDSMTCSSEVERSAVTRLVDGSIPSASANKPVWRNRERC